MVNVNKIKGRIVENETSIAELAKFLGIDKATLYRKLNNNGETLLIKEARGIIEFLHLTKDEAADIFFNHSVA